MKYASITDYAHTELRSFEAKPFSPVDSLILSQLAYNEILPIYSSPDCPSPLKIADTYRAEYFDTMFTSFMVVEASERLLSAAAASPRFRDLEISHYLSENDPNEEKQFSATCYRLREGLHYIAFRGTDDSLVGWKEDFSIAFKSPVPSQRRAAEYLSALAADIDGELILGGHSKGGNLAVYAAMAVSQEVQARISAVFNHDGPGFKAGVLDNDGYRRIEGKIQKTLPQSSLVGMLLDGHNSYKVVGSRRIGIMQHDPFSWEIDGDDFHTVEEVSDGAQYVNTALTSWLDGMTDAERERFVEILFGILDAGKAETITEINREWRNNFAAIFSAYKDADPEFKTFVRQLLKDFGSILAQNLKAKVLHHKHESGGSPSLPEKA